MEDTHDHVVAVCWSLFQSSLAGFLILDSVVIRATHLGFAMIIAFIGYPLFRRRQDDGLSIVGERWWSVALAFGIAALAFVSSIYLVIDYE